MLEGVETVETVEAAKKPVVLWRQGEEKEAVVVTNHRDRE